MSALFLSTSVLATAILSIAYIFLRRIKNTLYMQRWYSWLAITIAFTSSYLISIQAFRFLVVAVSFIMLLEFCNLIQLNNPLTALVLVLHLKFYVDVAFGLSATLFDSWVPWILFLVTLTSTKLSRGKDLAAAFYLLLLISVVFPLLVIQPEKSLALLLTVGVYDVASFIGGKSLAKNKFLDYRIFPKASPNKTLAGLLTGSLSVAVMLLVLGHFSLIGWLLISYFAPVGDYLESKVKRAVGVKDAGSWLPGFGGALDRFDSMLAVAAFAVFIF
jgi:phosphatidate cytidylyltransferase